MATLNGWEIKASSSDELYISEKEKIILVKQTKDNQFVKVLGIDGQKTVTIDYDDVYIDIAQDSQLIKITFK